METILSDIDNVVFDVSEETNSRYVPVVEIDGSDKWNVSSDDGSFKPTTNPRKSIELQLTSDIKTISYHASSYSGNFGYAFLNDNNECILGFRTTVAEKIIIDAATPIARGATKFRCSSAALVSNGTQILVDVSYIVKENKIEMLSSDIETELSKLIFNVSEANGGMPFDSLSDALGTNGANVPSEYRVGGMSIKFILQLYTVAKTTSQTQPTGTSLTTDPVIAAGTKYKASDLSDFDALPTTADVVYYISDEEATPTYTIYAISKNAVNACECVQYRYMSTATKDSTFVNAANWQGVASVIDYSLLGSDSLVTSRGILSGIYKSSGVVYFEGESIETGYEWIGKLDMPKGSILHNIGEVPVNIYNEVSHKVSKILHLDVDEWGVLSDDGVVVRGAGPLGICKLVLYKDLTIFDIKNNLDLKVPIKLGVNIFNKDNPDIVGVALNASNQIINDVSTYCVSEFIRVEPGQYYSLRNDKSQFGSYGLCFYDKNKTYISGISFSTVHNNGDFIRTPAITLGDSADCVYIKTSYDSTKEALAIYKG